MTKFGVLLLRCRDMKSVLELAEPWQRTRSEINAVPLDKNRAAFVKSWWFLCCTRIFWHLMEPESAWLCSQDPHHWVPIQPESNEPSLPPIFCNLILSFHLRLGLLNGLLRSGFFVHSCVRFYLVCLLHQWVRNSGRRTAGEPRNFYSDSANSHSITASLGSFYQRFFSFFVFLW